MAVKYSELLGDVARMTGTDAGIARAAAEATMTALARALPEPDRARLLRVLPAELTNDFPVTGGPRDWSAREFVREVSLLGRRPPEQARLRAQAVLSALADQEPDLVAGLHLPDEVRALFDPPGAGGGVYGPTGHAAPLTAGEVAAALETLPDWTGDTRGLRRTIVLPPDNLERVLARVRLLRENLGRGPYVRRGPGARPGAAAAPEVTGPATPDEADAQAGARPAETGAPVPESASAELVVRTAAVDAVTALDVELAARIDDLIADAGAGMAAP